MEDYEVGTSKLLFDDMGYQAMIKSLKGIVEIGLVSKVVKWGPSLME